MYSEMADLLSKLDGQMHELHQYYSLRPELHSLATCDKVTCQLSINYHIIITHNQNFGEYYW